MKINNKKYYLLFILFLGLLVNAQNKTLEFTPASAMGIGYTLDSGLFAFLQNTNNPTGTSYSDYNTHALTARFQISNIQYSGASSNYPTTPASNIVFGHDQIPPNPPVPAPINAYSLIPWPNNYFTSGTVADTGYNTETGGNTGVTFFTAAHVLFGQPMNKYHMADITITFNRPVNNPILHFLDLGAIFGDNLMSNEFELIEVNGSAPTISLSKLSGAPTLMVSGYNITNNEDLNFNGKAVGSVQFNGKNITTLKLKLYLDGNDVSGNGTAQWAEDINDNDNGDYSSISVSILESNLAVTKTVNNPTPLVGSNVTFTINASNIGISNSTNTTVTDLLPNGYTLVSATPSVGTYNSGTGVWSIGTLNDGASATLTVVATVNSTGNYTNTAVISGDNGDPVTTNNTASVTTVPTSPACPGPDSDGDGVADSCDLDDDNDGILDTDECTTINNVALFHLFDSDKASTTDFLRLYKQYTVGGAFVCPSGNSCPTDIVGLPYAQTNINGALPTNLAYGEGKYYVVNAAGNLLYTNDITTGNFTNLGNAQISGYKNLAFDNGIFYHWFNNSGTLQLYRSTNPVTLGWTNLGAITGRTLQYTKSGRLYELKDIAVDKGVFYFMYYTEDAVPDVSDNNIRTEVFTSSSPTSATPNWQNQGSTMFGYRTYDIAYGSEDTFAACDTDADGIPNHLDLDSDNDGCVDAIEGGENVTTAMLATASGTVTVGIPSTASNQNLGITVNPQGVPTVVNAGGSADTGGDVGQEIGNSQNSLVNDCTPACSGLDSDGDGTANECDLDDDNDGILDNDECGATNRITRGDFDNLPASPGLMNSAQFAAASSNNWTLTATNGSGVYWMNIGGFGNGISLQQDNQTQSLTQALTGVFNTPQNTGAQILISKFLAKNGVGGVGGPLQRGRSSTFTISYAGNEYVRVVTANGENTDATLAYSNGASGSISDILVGTDYNNWVITLPANVPTNGDLVIGFIGGLGNNDGGSDDFLIESITINSCADTDGDDIPDYLDLDSDNDGCVDAIEGDENVTTAMLATASGTVSVGAGSGASNQNLGTAVNPQGVPTVVNAGGAADIGPDQGQGIGSSTDVSINGCYCTKPGDFTVAGVPTKMGITVQDKLPTWPEAVPNGHIALESKEKGLVITRVTHVSTTPDLTNDSIKDPKEGMLIYDIQDACVKLFNGTTWNCINQSCNNLKFN